MLTSRFFTKDDEKVNKVIFPIPKTWWSRFYEYAWAMKFCNKEDIALDAACGIEHPFKLYLSQNCKEVYAIDIDKRITSRNKINKRMRKKLGIIDANIYKYRLNLMHGDITSIPLPDKKFNKIFCISALEHLLDAGKIKALKEFHRILKDEGMLILTLDYPTTDFEIMKQFVEDSGFSFAGGINKSIPANAITGLGLNCFRMVLVKG